MSLDVNGILRTKNSHVNTWRPTGCVIFRLLAWPHIVSTIKATCRLGYYFCRVCR